MRYAARDGGRVPHTIVPPAGCSTWSFASASDRRRAAPQHGVPFASLVGGRGQHQRPAGRRHDRQRADGRHESAVRERNGVFRPLDVIRTLLDLWPETTLELSPSRRRHAPRRR